MVRLHVFLSVAKLVTPFLTVYQTDLLMFPSLCSDLKGLLSDLAAPFIKASALKDATTAMKLLHVEVADEKTHLNATSVDIGFAAEQLLKEDKWKKTLSD